MTAPLGARARPYWRLLRARAPWLTDGVETARIAWAGRARLAADLQLARVRIHALERDHRLLAAHVATLSKRVERITAESGVRPSTGDEALTAVRLSAIAFYEHRIERLERRLRRALKEARHADRAERRATSREVEVNEA